MRKQPWLMPSNLVKSQLENLRSIKKKQIISPTPAALSLPLAEESISTTTFRRLAIARSSSDVWHYEVHLPLAASSSGKITMLLRNPIPNLLSFIMSPAFYFKVSDKIRKLKHNNLPTKSNLACMIVSAATARLRCWLCRLWHL